MRIRSLGWVLVGVMSSCSCGADEDPNCTLVEDAAWGPSGKVQIDVEVVVDGLEVPWGIAFLPDGRLLVTERAGRLVVVEGDEVAATVATIPVDDDGEGGLLGIALDPGFAESRAFFLYITSGSGNRVERWVLSDDATTATMDGLVLDGIPSARFHNGGRLRIGPDGMLYIGTGDARQPDSSQDTGSLAGKLLRIRPDGSVPDDNPFGNAVYVYGIRNTQGFDWRDDGTTMLITDHGPSGDTDRTDHDEVNVARPGDNLGWPDIYACESADGKVSPALTFESAVPPGGAAIYRGDAIPEWRGDLLVGSLGAEHLHRVEFDSGGERVAAHEVYLRGSHGRLRDVIMGPDGDLYVTTSNCDGRGDCTSTKDAILRITAP